MKNQGYLVEFIDSEAGNTYYECGANEYRQIMASFSASEVKDRTNCTISWQEYTEHCHSENLYASL